MKELKKSEACYVSGGGVVFFRDTAGRVVGEPSRQDVLKGKVRLSTPSGGSNITTLAFKHSRY
ncbi:hypothetical protein [Neisseria sp.]|uniref:hypothetical protein n=1 Tax=Neisseria sp. TaxID=192066 RepID=UPI0026DD6C78|nr:hypothetical protein [Neisseria sp.]MDO4906690.1 hypothetical protein [Neisseria sp.]